jgi:hypothetical protein
LKLQHDEVLLNFGFNFDVRRYAKATLEATVAATAAAAAPVAGLQAVQPGK